MAALAGQGRAGLAATWDHIPAGTLSPEPPEEELWVSSMRDPGWGSRDPGSDTGREHCPLPPRLLSLGQGDCVGSLESHLYVSQQLLLSAADVLQLLALLWGQVTGH